MSANPPLDALLVLLARFLTEAGYTVVRYDLPFRRSGQKGPPMPAQGARDREGVAQAVAFLRTHTAGRIFAGGHSYGGRQTSMAAAENPPLADALLLLSYPLHPPGRPAQLRTDHFPNLRTPCLFVHGAKDGFATSDELRDAVALIPAPIEILTLPSAGHELRRAAALFPDILSRCEALALPVR